MRPRFELWKPKQRIATSNGNSTFWLLCLDDNFVITFEDGSSYGKTGYISYSSTSVRADVAEISDLKIRMHGDTAVVTGTYHEKGSDKGESYDYHDVFTDVWMKKAGKWRLIASHYSIPAKK